jgi:uncharacterized protein YnzC (UPF0291/DUF896 family)
LDDNIDDYIFAFNPDLKPKTDTRGLTSMAFTGDDEWKDLNKKRREYLKTFNDIYKIRIDSVEVPAEFIVGNNVQKQLGFETYVGTDSLNQGKHMLNILRKWIRSEDTTFTYVRTIPFWYYRN